MLKKHAEKYVVEKYVTEKHALEKYILEKCCSRSCGKKLFWTNKKFVYLIFINKFMVLKKMTYS